MLLVVSLISCVKTSGISATPWPLLPAILTVENSGLVMQFENEEPIFMTTGAGKQLLKYFVDLKDWGLYHYGN